jgi:hypothetical protein
VLYNALAVYESRMELIEKLLELESVAHKALTNANSIVKRDRFCANEPRPFLCGENTPWWLGARGFEAL